MKLGHRRVSFENLSPLEALEGVCTNCIQKLQRKIANSRGLSLDRALLSPRRQTPSEDRHSEEGRDLLKSDIKDGGPSSGKRKYRRHPKVTLYSHSQERDFETGQF